MFNQAILVGRLGRDPDTKATTKGTSVSNFSIAVDSGFGDKRRTEWFNIVAFGKLAEIVQKFLKKGSLVLVEGRIQIREYEYKGEKKKSTEIIANTVQFLDKVVKSAAEGEGSQVADESDDIPF